MVIVKIIGGLGNQMFQYAYAKALEQRGYEVKIDISEFEKYKLHGGYQLNKYNIDLISTSKEENIKFNTNSLLHRISKKLNIPNCKIICEKSLLFDHKLLDIKDGCYIYGYFQCEKYFKDIRSTILKQFTINQEISNYTKEIENEIHKYHNSCSLHVRRGDFINKINLSIHGACDIEYYKKAIQFLDKEVGKIKYFIFSDDMDWVQQNLYIENAVYIDSKEKRIPHEDIYLMSLCKNNIIANSSFSWWGAWLNKNEQKIVIAPKKCFTDKKLDEQSKDIACKNWVKL